MSSVQIDAVPNTVEIVTEQSTVTVEQVTHQITISASGPQGIPGPRGADGQTELGGYPTVINSPGVADILQFTAQNTWINSSLLDGGNF